MNEEEMNVGATYLSARIRVLRDELVGVYESAAEKERSLENSNQRAAELEKLVAELERIFKSAYPKLDLT